jgi:sterol desaturase/sphingolipid hydroxylase (fatty acid hydroxylase superfamily)
MRGVRSARKRMIANLRREIVGNGVILLDAEEIGPMRATVGIGMRARELLAYLTFPVLMGGLVWLAVWGLARGFPPGAWGAALSVLNFFVILGVEQVLPRNRLHNVFRDRQSWNDMGHGVLLAAVARPLGTAAGVLAIAQLGELRVAASLASLWPTGWAFPLQMLLGFALVTFADYWVHRSLHSFDRLWWFHSIHHDTPQMHILKSGRIHLGEELISAATKNLPLLLLGVPVDVLVLLGMWRVFDGNLVHSNIDQRFPSWGHYFLPTVQLHNLHHARDRRHQDSNYSGSSAVWDVLFGTFSHPDRCPLGALGIEDSPVPRGFLAQMAFPLRSQWRPPEPAVVEAGGVRVPG